MTAITSCIVRTWAVLASILLATWGSSARSGADEWPGWMGPDRDGVYRETGIVDEIPREGLPIKWRKPIHGGYAGPAVAGGRVFVFDYKRDSQQPVENDPNGRSTVRGSERLIAFDAESGKQLWVHSYPCAYDISYPAGPRCTPSVDGNQVYILGSQGDLKCLNVEDGEVVWSRNLARDFDAEVPLWGFASHPLITDQLLYTMVGGKGQGVVALDKMTGDVRWKAVDAEAGYCPLSLIEAGGTTQLIAFHPKAVVGLDPQDGTEYWSVSIEPAYGMSIARPMVDGNRMFVSANSDAIMLELASDRPAVKELWRGEPSSALYTSNSTPLFIDGVIFGTDEKVGSLMAVNADDAERLWQTFEPVKPGETRRVKQGTAFVTRIGQSDRYLLMSEYGSLHLAELTADGYVDRGSFPAVARTHECFGRRVVWSHPAYAGRTAFIRNDVEIVAVDLAKQP